MTSAKMSRSASRSPVEWWKRIASSVSSSRSSVAGLAEMIATGTRSTNEPAAQLRALNVPTPYWTQAAPMPLKRA